MSRTTTQRRTEHPAAIPGRGRRDATGHGRRRRSLAVRAGAALATVALLGTAGPALATTADSDDATVDAMWLVEEERAAGDLYREFATLYPQASVFSRVARAEDRHLASAERATGLTAGTVAGVYADSDLQALYDTWLAEGSVSCEAALAAAVELETADIAELDAVIAQATAQGEPTTVWKNQRTGSEHHLAAFSTATACTGGTGVGAGHHAQEAGRGTGTGQATGSGHHGQGTQGGGTGQATGSGHHGQGTWGGGAGHATGSGHDRRQDGSCQDA